MAEFVALADFTARGLLLALCVVLARVMYDHFHDDFPPPPGLT